MKAKMTWIMMSWLLILFLGACASQVYRHPLMAADRLDASAEVYFFRKATFAAGAIAIPVYLEGQKLLQLRNGTYTKIYLKPGSYVVGVGENRPSTTGLQFADYTQRMDFAAGQTYFILLRPSTAPGGLFQTTLVFFQPDVISAAEAEPLKSELTPISAGSP